MVDSSEISDGYHTLDELYQHRDALFIVLAQQMPNISWRSKQHEDGTMYPGYFVAGMDLPAGQISYHLPMNFWDYLSTVHTLPYAKWDGHMPADVPERLLAWAKTVSDIYNNA